MFAFPRGMIGFLSWARWIYNANLLVVPEPIRAPLPHVTVEIMQTESVCRLTSYRWRARRYRFAVEAKQMLNGARALTMVAAVAPCLGGELEFSLRW